MAACTHADVCRLEAEGESQTCILHAPSPAKDVTRVRAALLAHVEAGRFDFSHMHFLEELRIFCERKFPQKVVFRNCTFHGEVLFTASHFTQEASFREATFKRDVNFSHAIFEERVSFVEAKFRRMAYFWSSEFRGVADLMRAQFRKTANFVNAKFRAESYFQNVEFEGPAWFKTAQFCGRADFQEATFRDMGTFVGSAHMPLFAPNVEIVMTSCVFEDLRGVRFDTVDLSWTSFLRTDLRGVTFANVTWRRAQGRQILYDEYRLLQGPRNTGELLLVEQLYTQLKDHFETQHDYYDAGHFHYGEMEMRRMRIGLHRDPWLWLYWLLSGYSERSVRAFAWLVLLFVVFAAFYASAWGLDLPADKAITTSLRALTRQPTDAKSLSVTIESIAGPLQLALLALALQRRLKR